MANQHQTAEHLSPHQVTRQRLTEPSSPQPKSVMQREMRARLGSLPRTEASFVEPMECLAVSTLPEGAPWIWETRRISSACGEVANWFDAVLAEQEIS